MNLKFLEDVFGDGPIVYPKREFLNDEERKKDKKASGATGKSENEPPSKRIRLEDERNSVKVYKLKIYVFFFLKFKSLFLIVPFQTFQSQGNNMRGGGGHTSEMRRHQMPGQIPRPRPPTSQFGFHKVVKSSNLLFAKPSSYQITLTELSYYPTIQKLFDSFV